MADATSSLISLSGEIVEMMIVAGAVKYNSALEN